MILELVKRFPFMVKVHLCWIIGSSLFLIVTGMMDLFGHTVFNIKAPGVLLGLLFLAQVFFYFSKPERWITG